MRVEESKQRDVGKRRARIGHNAMDYLHVAPGDIIEIKGSKTSCAIVWPSDEDEKTQILFDWMDKLEKTLEQHLVM
uniref:AAA family ATPase (VCP, CDC48) n=1 Tax=uncultured marine thaumarchaeote AD1000_50_E11 TaxID=1455923 RepID=A0A075FYM8_9ARCH|nr:AAA family ATPase (VCP, CDC48) [uncultured marine thaumarchaeote AD1000_50_E11]